MRDIARRLVAAATAAALIATVVPATARATFPGAVGKIAIGACGAEDCGVFLVDPSGSGGTQLTHNPYRIFIPRNGTVPAEDAPISWTPDGRRLLYVRVTGSGSEARIVNADGSGDEPFAPGAGVFSPDGSKLAYIEFIPPGYPQIFVKNIDGSGVQQLTFGEGPGSGRGDPDWSPDGTKIAFTGPGPGTDVYVMNADGSNQTRLLNSVTRSGWAPSWAPDGTKIAFTSRIDGGGYEIFVINSDGSGGPVNLSNNPVPPPGAGPVDHRSSAWSPDGTRIAFVSEPFDNSPIRLLVMSPDGSGAHELPTTGALNGFSAPTWQSLPAPRRADYKNASHFCKAERQFLGAEAFRQRYGGGANAHGKCVSRN